MKFMQYTKFMNDDDVDDTNLFDPEETEISTSKNYCKHAISIRRTSTP